MLMSLDNVNVSNSPRLRLDKKELKDTSPNEKGDWRYFVITS